MPSITIIQKLKERSIVGFWFHSEARFWWAFWYTFWLSAPYLSAWGGCLFVVYILRFIYKLLNVCPFDYTAVAGNGKAGPVNQVNHTSWVTVVTPTDRPKSVRNRSVIELFCGVFCVVTLPFWHLCWCMGFYHRTESDLFLFLCEDLLW